MGEGLGLRCRVQGPWGSQDPERSPERRGLCVCLPCEVPYQKKKRSKTLYGPEDGRVRPTLKVKYSFSRRCTLNKGTL